MADPTESLLRTFRVPLSILGAYIHDRINIESDPRRRELVHFAPVKIHRAVTANHRIFCFLNVKPDSVTPYTFDIVALNPLLGNDSEISNYTTAVTRERLANSNRETVFSVRSVQRYYKQTN
jgi:hypothetical protein